MRRQGVMIRTGTPVDTVSRDPGGVRIKAWPGLLGLEVHWQAGAQDPRRQTYLSPPVTTKVR